MIGLKSFVAVVAGIIGCSASALYERQRALVRAGVFPEAERGRGKGLPATPENVAVLILAILATDSISETDERVAELARLPIDRSNQRCPVTEKSNLLDVLAETLSKPDLAKQVEYILVARSRGAAMIAWMNGRPGVTFFGSMYAFQSIFNPDTSKSDVPIFDVEAKLYGPALSRIAAELEADRIIAARQAVLSAAKPRKT